MIDRLKANGVKFSLTRRREIAKWKEASLLRVFAFDSEIPRAARPAGGKKEREEDVNQEITLLCVFASSREALFVAYLNAIGLKAKLQTISLFLIIATREE
ncbi:MAG: hypothetical protein SF339_25025 [Blastocatellia bacterium]|nr:hypothetical protein [Blastocatellia bacterium]